MYSNRLKITNQTITTPPVNPNLLILSNPNNSLKFADLVTIGTAGTKTIPVLITANNCNTAAMIGVIQDATRTTVSIQFNGIVNYKNVLTTGSNYYLQNGSLTTTSTNVDTKPNRFMGIALNKNQLLWNPDSLQTMSNVKASIRHYFGTAAVGDFMQITLDPNTNTFSYVNSSNNTSGFGSYIQNQDGTMTINESSNAITKGLEIPGFALVLAADNTGPNKDTTALVCSLHKQVMTLDMITNRTLNYMQFRVNSGGMELGSVNFDTIGNISIKSYSPYHGQMQNGDDAFKIKNNAIPPPVADPTTGALKVTETHDDQTDYCYIFSTIGGLLAIDNSNGSIMAFDQSANTNFPTGADGTYTTFIYYKTNAATGEGNVETPNTGTIIQINIVITPSTMTITDATNTWNLNNVPLTPLPNTLSGPLTDTCPGLFYSVNDQTNQQYFVALKSKAILISSFKINQQDNSKYNYFYGFGLLAR